MSNMLIYYFLFHSNCHRAIHPCSKWTDKQIEIICNFDWILVNIANECTSTINAILVVLMTGTNAYVMRCHSATVITVL